MFINLLTKPCGWYESSGAMHPTTRMTKLISVCLFPAAENLFGRIQEIGFCRSRVRELNGRFLLINSAFFSRVSAKLWGLSLEGHISEFHIVPKWVALDTLPMAVSSEEARKPVETLQLGYLTVVFVPQKGKKGTFIGSFLCPSIRLSGKIIFLRDAWMYQVDINTKYSSLRSLEAEENQGSKSTRIGTVYERFEPKFKREAVELRAEGGGGGGVGVSQEGVCTFSVSTTPPPLYLRIPAHPL
ncbi:hypothetical protein EVAR_66199_1 [Eumeta japonica]|uniref:Uncharacterized protein n=1 Tax=Eumeta variegata TaxID=151549 RepID=A0A4C1ZJQ6_EUMVA|nr:hypothetical protein EVAR_66199_1 [Eumeta japonica]